ncbi:hypothetical protein BCR39DRAFT_511836 [Naematelia encephala]|uniref:Uncharacterized protein n=1 Tax=Naematelia encephala TaxID=71784 RepID=A0A1Y2BLT6_9TREE|nr:hypothetical protein BCR39DRAFT_511836 [Naematelia encephala]
MESSAPLNLHRPGSAIAKKARAALGLVKSREEESDLRVYVKREMQVSETNLVPKLAIVKRGTGSQRKPPSPASPADTLSTRWERDGEDGHEEATARRLRRLQLVKLQRLLGVPIPASLIGPNSTDDLPSSSSFSASFPTPNHSRSNSSFIDLAEPRATSPSPASWANKFKQGMSIRERKPKFMSDSSSSFLDMRGSPAGAKSGSAAVNEASIEGMSEGEKTAARRKAHKLEQVFGDTPPQDMFLSTHHVQRPPVPLRQTSSESKILLANQTVTSTLEQPLSSYTQSIEGLLYLAENDHSRFADLLDSLDPSSSSSPPPSPTPSVKSHAARRRRTGKLSHFFGETGVDFDNPPQQQGQGQGKVSIALVKKRRETLDSVLGELWRGLQGELRRGRATRGDVDRLGEMVGVLRRTRNGWEEL